MSDDKQALTNAVNEILASAGDPKPDTILLPDTPEVRELAAGLEAAYPGRVEVCAHAPVEGYATRVAKSAVLTADIFNLARGLDRFVVATLCERLGLSKPGIADTVNCGFCDDAGTPCMRGDASHFGWDCWEKISK